MAKINIKITTSNGVHNNLVGLQGVGSDYIHLNQGEYDNFLIMLGDFIQPPIYVNPSSSLDLTEVMYEVGTDVNVDIIQSFNQNDGGLKLSETIEKNNIIVSNTSMFSEVLTIPVGITTYSGEVFYAQGDCKDNNIGVEDCTGRIEAGSSISADKDIIGIYPVFYYKSPNPITGIMMDDAIRNGFATKLLINSEGTIEVPYAPNNEHYAIAYPATSTTKTRWKESELSQGDIPGGLFSAVEIITTNSPDGNWDIINYKMHSTPLLSVVGIPTIELIN